MSRWKPGDTWHWNSWPTSCFPRWSVTSAKAQRAWWVNGCRVRPGSRNAPVGQQEWALQVQLSVLWRWVEGQGGSLSFQLHFGPNFVLSHLNRIMLSSHSIVVLSCQQVQRQRRQYSAVPRDYDHSLLAVPRGSCLVIASLLGHYGCVLK